MSRGAAVGTSLRSLGILLRSDTVPLEAANLNLALLTGNVLEYFRETNPVAYRSIQSSFNPPESTTADLAAYLVAPDSAAAASHIPTPSAVRTKGEKRKREAVGTFI